MSEGAATSALVASLTSHFSSRVRSGVSCSGLHYTLISLSAKSFILFYFIIIIIFYFWLPGSIWSSQARDPNCSCNLCSSHGRILEPLPWARDWTCLHPRAPETPSPWEVLPLPSLATFTFLLLVFIHVCTVLNTLDCLRETARWYRKGFDSYTTRFFTGGRKQNPGIYANFTEVHGWLWIYSIISMCVLSVFTWIISLLIALRDTTRWKRLCWLTIYDGCLLFLSNQYLILSSDSYCPSLPLGKIVSPTTYSIRV